MFIFRNKNEVEIRNTVKKHGEARLRQIEDVVESHIKFIEKHYPDNEVKPWTEYIGD